MKQVARMDFIGATLVAGAVTSIVLALQWGGNVKPWDDKAVIIVSSKLLTDSHVILDRALLVFRFVRSPHSRLHFLGDIPQGAGHDPYSDCTFALRVRI
jgi:hypothetical protein